MDFNSHAHVERDIVLLWHAVSQENFNSHAHVERDIVVMIVANDCTNFNSHAHVERDVLPKPETTLPPRISTHTLTWSVTQTFLPSLFRLRFQLTRSRGA